MLLLKRQDELWGPVAEAYYCRTLKNCKYMCKCISACNFEGWMLWSKHIQKKGSQTAQDPQKTEGSNDSQQQNGLWVHTVIFQKFWINVSQHVRNPEFLPRTSSSVNAEPGRLGQGGAQRGDRQSSRQSRHQAPLRLFGQRRAASSPPNSRHCWSRRSVHGHPLNRSSYSTLDSPLP